MGNGSLKIFCGFSGQFTILFHQRGTHPGIPAATYAPEPFPLNLNRSKNPICDASTVIPFGLR
jgi:hypothetical protein